MKNRRPLAFAVVVLVALVLFFLAANRPERQLALRMDEYLTAQHTVGQFSGSALVARGEHIFLRKGYGLANQELDVPNEAETKFRLGSITKSFTGMAIMLLQEQDKLSVEDAICGYIERCPEAWEAITIHHLLTHTSGIPDNISLPGFWEEISLPHTVEELVEQLKGEPLDFAPGERFSYSNGGYAVLGHIIERASGQSYEQFIQSNIFGPLGMSDSGYDHASTILPNRATGYTKELGLLINAPYMDMSVPYAAGSLYSTVGDMYLWSRAIATSSLLSERSQEQMFAPSVDTGLGLGGTEEGEHTMYGYGWMVGEQLGRPVVMHTGGIFGFMSLFAYYPEEEMTVILLSNRGDLSAFDLLRMGQDLAAIVHGEPYEIPQKREPANVDPSLYNDYAGQYELTISDTGLTQIATVTRDGTRLLLQFERDPVRLEILPESESVFYLEESTDLRITFVRDEEGEVTQIVFSGAGPQMAGQKIR